MKVGDLVDFKGWRGIIVDVDRSRVDPDEQVVMVFYSLHFLGTAPTHLRRGKEGFYPGFHPWELEVVSATL